MDEGIGSKRIIIRRTSGLAIASKVLGISGIVLWFLTFGIPGFIGLPLGIAALVQIHKSGGTATGRGMAIAGIITSSIPVAGFIFLFLLPLVFAFKVPSFDFGLFDRIETVRLFRCFISATAVILGQGHGSPQ